MSGDTDTYLISQAVETTTSEDPAIACYDESESPPQVLYPPTTEENMDIGMTPDVSLAEFLSRPVKIFNDPWPIGSGNYSRDVYPTALYFADPAVKKKIDNYAYISGMIHTKIITTGTSFHYGRIICSLEMYPDGTAPEVVSSMPHIFVDANSATGGVISFPIAFYFNGIPLQGYGVTQQMVGAIFMRSLSQLRVVGDTTAPLQVSGYVWMTDVKLKSSTALTSVALVSQAGEAEVPNEMLPPTDWPSVIYKLPVIGKYVKASTMAARTGMEIASLFGYSRPTVYHDEKRVLPAQVGNLAFCNVHDSTVKLAMDAKNEVFIDPSVVGLGSSSDMELLEIAKRSVNFASPDWTTSIPADTLFYRIAVNPNLSFSVGLKGGIALTPMGHVSSCFKYWRGTIKFRIEILCTPFHRGKLRIAYDPVNSFSSGLGIGEFNTTYSHIIDLSESNSYDFCVGWGVNQPYLQVQDPSILSHTGNPTTSILNPLFHNGYVAISVLSPLTVGVGATSTAAPAMVKLWAYAGDDFAWGMPTTDLMVDKEIYKSSAQFIVSTVAQSPLESQALQLAQIGSSTAEIVPQENLCLNNVPDYNDDGSIAGTHMGERIVSLRQLLKRYTYVDTLCLTSPSLSKGKEYRSYLQTWNIPPNKGKVIGASVAPSNPSIIGQYTYVRLSYFGWFYPVFMAYRGSSRWKYFVSNDSTDVKFHFHDVANATTRVYNIGTTPLPTDIDTVASRLPAFQRYMNAYGNGATLGVPRLFPTLEFETPYYNNNRFIPITRTFNDTGVILPWRPNMHLYSAWFSGHDTETNSFVDVHRFFATGDDFSFYVYKCSPVMFVRNIPDAV